MEKRMTGSRAENPDPKEKIIPDRKRRAQDASILFPMM